MCRGLLGLIVGCGLWLLAGCQPQAGSPATKVLPLTGQTVELTVPADLALRDLWEPLLQEWTAQTGGTVTWSEYEHDQPPWIAEKSSAAGPNGGRLLLLPLARLADADAAGWLTPFPAGVVEHVDGKDILPGLKDAALSRQKKLVAAPVSAPVLLCYYRKDLLDAAGHAPPRTWDEYQDLVDQLPQWAPDLPAFEPCGPDFRASLFLARSAAFAKHPQNYSVWFDIQTGEPLFDSPAFERALETARKAWSAMPTDVWTMNPAACRQAIVAGKAALALAWEPSAEYPRTPTSDLAAANRTGEPLSIGVVPLPGTRSVYQSAANRWEEVGAETPHQPGCVGVTGLTFGVTADNDRAAAWNLLETLTARQELAFAERPRSIGRESEASATVAEIGDMSVETVAQIIQSAAETLRRRDLTFDLAIPQAESVRAIFAEELAAANDPAKSTPDILKAIQQRVTEATQAQRLQIRDAYRRSVGLAAMK